MEATGDIVIVGAGIAGLAASLGLHRMGIPSIVLESSESLRVSGFGFATWTNAWKALDAIGLGDLLRQQHKQILGLVGYSTITGQHTVKMSFTSNGKRADHEVRCVRRSVLLEALEKELPSGTIRYNSQVVSIEDSGYLKLVHLADGSILKAKVLIGCDGVNSVVGKWLGFKRAASTGRIAIRGIANFKEGHGFEPLFQQFFGKGARAGIIPIDDTTVYWFFTWTPLTQEEGLEEEATKLKELVLSKFEKVDQFRVVLENTDLDSILLSPLRYRHPWELLWGNITKGNVCVTGDAFHPMTPDVGQGACSALEDAVVLARSLGEVLLSKQGTYGNDDYEEKKHEYERIQEGLKNYAKERKWRAFDLVTTSYAVGFVQQSTSKIMTILRDNILASVMAQILLRRTDFDCGNLTICL